MDETLDVPEITEACWGILGVDPKSVMCASARMVVKRKGAAAPGGAALHACCPTTCSSRWARTLSDASGEECRPQSSALARGFVFSAVPPARARAEEKPGKVALAGRRPRPWGEFDLPPNHGVDAEPYFEH